MLLCYKKPSRLQQTNINGPIEFTITEFDCIVIEHSCATHDPLPESGPMRSFVRDL